MRKMLVYSLAAAALTGVLVIAPVGQALALCNPGTPHCIKVPRDYPVRNKATVGNAGDCVGSTNETCGYHTGLARPVSHNSPVAHSGGSRR